MHESIEKVKSHLKANKMYYITAGASLAIGSVLGGAVMLRTPEVQAVQKIIGPAWKPQQMIIQFVERSTPSRPIHKVGTKEYYDSINDAARKTGHTASNISKVVNGIRPDIHGDVFEDV